MTTRDRDYYPPKRLLVQFIKPFNRVRDGSVLAKQFRDLVDRARLVAHADPNVRRDHEARLAADVDYQRLVDAVQRQRYMEVPWPTQDAIDNCWTSFRAADLTQQDSTEWHRIESGVINVLRSLGPEIETRGFRRDLSLSSAGGHLLHPFIAAIFTDFDGKERETWALYLYRLRPTIRPFLLREELYEDLPSPLKWAMVPGHWYADISHVTEANANDVVVQLRNHLARRRITMQGRREVEREWGERVIEIPGYTSLVPGYEPPPKEGRGRPPGKSADAPVSRRCPPAVRGRCWREIASQPRTVRRQFRQEYLTLGTVADPAKNFDNQIRRWRNRLGLPKD